MPNALPNLDDRRWDDLVQDAVALVPVHAPDWTDHNAHDPGVTLIELFAFVTERQIYRVNRVPEARKRRMLGLAGLAPLPPRSARVVAAFSLAEGADPVALPPTTEGSAGGVPVRLMQGLTVAGTRIVSLRRSAGGILTDLAGALGRGERLPLFEAVPAAGDAVTIALESRARPGDRIALYLRLLSRKSSRDERRRAIEDRLRRRAACAPPPDPCGARPRRPRGGRVCGCDDAPSLRCEALGKDGDWRMVDIVDGTRGLSQDGAILLRATGETDSGRITLRITATGGEWDSPRMAIALVPDAVEAEQSRSIWHTFRIAPGAEVAGVPPASGERRRLALALDPSGAIARLDFDAEGPIAIAVLEYVAPGREPGRVTLDIAPLRMGDGAPWQEFRLVPDPAVALGASVWSLEDGGWRSWRPRPDFFGSGPGDADWTEDPDGRARFGDGAEGRVLPDGAWALARLRATLAGGGAIAEGAALSLAATPRNAALLGDVAAVAARLGPSAVAATLEAGRDREPLADAILREASGRETTGRAITAPDFARLALDAPGRDVARAIPRADLHPSLVSAKAPGLVTVVVVPNRPGPRPRPSAGLLSAVRRRLDERRLLGTGLRVVGPDYREVACRARLRARPQAAIEPLRARAAAALDRFLDPLTGGADGGGWPLGRDVYRAEIMALLDAIDGVDHVLALELDIDGTPSCGDACIGPLALIAPGAHRIEAVR
ncbi:putative baseplate assembly protein [Methylobacterium currus]|uniref:Putative baseplate assembly protein n=1 Tax=Methylobacterium currus TaxID=2051553 RepID=A0A2R4WMK9_9HYPH|nr:putative baseplate assembly protein [Methylobacterium currus]AWB22781.1 putative baseplate assembly protein [Methylobacterium currus]